VSRYAVQRLTEIESKVFAGFFRTFSGHSCAPPFQTEL
jgi:hypothetical protein